MLQMNARTTLDIVMLQSKMGFELNEIAAKT